MHHDLHELFVLVQVEELPLENMASWSALMPSNGMGSLKLPTVNGKARESRSERSCRSRSSSEDGASCQYARTPWSSLFLKKNPIALF